MSNHGLIKRFFSMISPGQYTYSHPTLGLLTYQSGIWIGEVLFEHSTIGIFIRSPKKEPEADILNTVLYALQNLDQFIDKAQDYIVADGAYKQIIDQLKPGGISAWQNGHWGLQFEIPNDLDVLEVIFVKDKAIELDCH